MHSRVTRNNTPGLIPAPTVTASSEGGNISKAPPRLATSEGEESSIETDVPNIWYDQPREKRRKVSTGNTKPPRRSRRFTKEQNERLDVVDEAAQEVEHEQVSKQFMEEKTNFGLGLTPKRVTRSSVKEPIKRKAYTPAPPPRSPQLISQEALNAFATGQ